MNDRFQHIIDAIKEKAAATLPEGSQVILFGSRARGNARSDSDWDLLVLVPGPERLPFAVMRNYGRPIEELGWEMDEEFNTIVHTFSGWEKRWFLPLYP